MRVDSTFHMKGLPPKYSIEGPVFAALLNDLPEEPPSSGDVLRQGDLQWKVRAVDTMRWYKGYIAVVLGPLHGAPECPKEGPIELVRV